MFTNFERKKNVQYCRRSVFSDCVLLDQSDDFITEVEDMVSFYSSLNAKSYSQSFESHTRLNLNRIILTLGWSYMYFGRLLSNFEHRKGGIVRVKEILSEAEKVKENIACPASSCLFGRLIKQLWGERVTLVKHGSPKQGHQNYHQGLERKSPDGQSSNTSLNDFTPITPLKSGWHLVSDGHGRDQPGDLSFIRHESLSFKNQRVMMEARLLNENGSDSIFLAYHGCHTDITAFFELGCLEKYPLRERMDMILTFVDSSTLCRECQLQMERSYIPLFPMKVVIFRFLQL